MSEREASREVTRATLAAPLARALGIVATLLACVFVWRELSAVGILSFSVWRSPSAWVGLAALGVVYSVAGLLLADAWVGLLNSGSWGTLARRDGVAIFARTQLFKYLPSNVLHVAGRFASLRRRGVPNAAIIRSTGLEHLSLAAVALTLAAVFMLPNLRFWTEVDSRTAISRYLMIGVGLLVVLLLVAGVAALRAKRGWFHQVRDWVFDGLAPAVAAKTVLLHVGFFLTTGALALVLAWLAGSELPAGSIPTITGTLAFAWLAGFLTPGAPGGIGVRETVLIIGLEPVLGLEAVTFLAVGYRFVTILGDLLLAALGAGIGRQRNLEAA